MLSVSIAVFKSREGENMKRLLLFIVMLFGILSVQSFAWNYGCGENIPPHVCGADGSNSGNNSYGGSSTTLVDAPAVRQYLLKLSLDGSKYELIDMGTTDFLTALDKMIYGNMCRNSEICEIVHKRNYSAVVISEDNRIFEGGADTYYKGTAKKAEKMAIEQCKAGKESNGKGVLGDGFKGKKCKLVMMLSPNFKLEDKRSGERFELKVTSSL